MNEKKRIFRTMITPALKDLARLCRLNEYAFVTIVEIEPGKVIQVSFLPGKSILKRSMSIKPDTVDNTDHFDAGSLNEQKINIAKGIRAERG